MTLTSCRIHTPWDELCILFVSFQEHVLICMLMESSHGDQAAPPTVDVRYINKSRSLILELRAQDVLSKLEERYVSRGSIEF